MSNTIQVNYKDTFLISSTTVKKLTGLGSNVDDTIIEPAITLSQDMYLQSIIGTYLLDELKRQIFENNLTTDYEYLLDNYVSQTLAYTVAENVQIPLGFKIVNKGVVQSNDENLVNVSYSEVKSLQKYYKDKAEFYGQRLLDYLCENKTSYQQFMNPRDTSDMNSKKSSYTSGTNIFTSGRKISDAHIFGDKNELR